MISQLFPDGNGNEGIRKNMRGVLKEKDNHNSEKEKSEKIIRYFFKGLKEITAMK
jgi:hypothetical protein